MFRTQESLINVNKPEKIKSVIFELEDEWTGMEARMAKFGLCNYGPTTSEGPLSK